MNHWTVNDIPDLRGRVALVTGANRGLGLETTRAFATHGAHVIMAVRNLNQGRLAEIHDLNDWDRRIIEEFRANGGNVEDRDPSSTTPCNFCESVVYCLHEQSTCHF